MGCDFENEYFKNQHVKTNKIHIIYGVMIKKVPLSDKCNLGPFESAGRTN